MMKQALAEAYASASVSDLVMETIELHHPKFVDELGVRTAVRIVKAFEPFTAKLENTAPLNPNQYVEFKPIPFDMTPAGFKEGDVPTMNLSISNVSREITRYLELAIADKTPIIVMYRPYLESDPSEPQLLPVVVMSITSAEASLMHVTATATLSDVHNWPFPAVKYTPDTFPGLVR